MQDEGSDRAEWIELHNSGPDPASLLNWMLTDNAPTLRSRSVVREITKAKRVCAVPR